MNTKTFNEKLKQNPLPVVVDFWASWCGPCKAVKPVLEKLAIEYAGRVDFWQINADENPEILQDLKVYGIPTLVVFRDGKESLRQVGAKPASALKALFEAVATGVKPPPAAALSTLERLIRMGVGIVVVVVSFSNQPNWLLILMGAGLMFSADYDRCPIWRALTDKYKELTSKA